MRTNTRSGIHGSMKGALLSLTLLALPAVAQQPQQLTSPDQVPEGLAKSDWSSIRAAHEGWKHQFNPVEGGWQARNPGQQWNTRFDGRGFMTTPQGASWTWGMEFQSYGFSENLTRISGTPEVRAIGQRLGYQWNDNVEEWFINDQRGLEHGFIVKERPEGAQPGEALSFTMSATGSLKPSVSSDALTVHFRDAAGAPVLNYSGLKVWDAEGTILPSRFERGEDNTFRLLVEESTARYPITIDPIAQQAYLKASNTGADDWFGISVAVSGDTVVVGAYAEDSNATGVNGNQTNNNVSNTGAAYVFTRNSGVWTQQAYLKASSAARAGVLFGWSVALSGNTLVVGAYREVSSATGVNGNQSDTGAFASGAAYVFTRSSGAWTQQAYLKASNTGMNDEFGYSVGVSGDTVVVGARYESSSTTGVNSTPNESASFSGAAYVFTRSGTTWSQQAYLKASNTGAFDYFGASVAVSGDTVVVGAQNEDSSTTGVNSTSDNSASDSGAAYIFTRSSGIWAQQAYLKASNTGANDRFGESVALSGDTVVVGAYQEASNATGVNGNQSDNSTVNSGAAYVFARSGATWSQQAYLKASNTGANDAFGRPVAVAGDTIVVGAWGENSSTAGVNSTPNESVQSGAAYVFTRSTGIWTQQAFLKASNTGEGDVFSASVAVSGDTVIVGARSEDSNATGINGVQTNNSVTDSGAAYIFTGFGPSTTAPSITTQPASSTIFSGATATLSVTATGGTTTYTYQWYQGAVGTTTTPVGTNSASLTTPALTATTTYWVRVSNANGFANSTGATVTVTQPVVAPIITTQPASALTTTTATLNGNVLSDGGTTITERGFVYAPTSTNADPILSGDGVVSVTSPGTTGAFSVPLSDLPSGTAYSFKAYATNSIGTAYSTLASFTTKFSPRDLVGTWFTPTEDGGIAYITFLDDGTYHHTEDGTADESGHPGLEVGTYTWDTETGALSTTPTVDQNGEWGLSHNAPDIRLLVNNGQLQVVEGVDVAILERPASSSAAIVGSWVIISEGRPAVIVFLADGTYRHSEVGASVGGGFSGMEKGTYVWNPASGALTASPALDQNGEWGLSHPLAPFVITAAGDQLTILEGSLPFIGQRADATTALSAFLGDASIPYNQRGPLDDSDKDGISNLIEYALGLVPNSASVAGLPTALAAFNPATGKNHLTLTMTLKADATGIVLTPQVASNLSVWNSGSSHIQTVSDTTSNGVRTWVVRDLTPIGDQPGGRFLRLSVQQNSP